MFDSEDLRHNFVPEAGQLEQTVRNGWCTWSQAVAWQATPVYGRADYTHHSMSHHLQEPPWSLSTIPLCQRERGLRGGMQGAV